MARPVLMAADQPVSRVCQYAPSRSFVRQDGYTSRLHVETWPYCSSWTYKASCVPFMWSFPPHLRRHLCEAVILTRTSVTQLVLPDKLYGRFRAVGVEAEDFFSERAEIG